MIDWGGKVAAWLGGVTLASSALATIVGPQAKGFWRAAFIFLIVLAGLAFIALLSTGLLALWDSWRKRKNADSADPTSDMPFEIRPVQKPGENKCSKIRGAEHGSLTDPELFYVRLHFTLWTRYDVELINLDLAYDWPGTAPERQYCEIDRVAVKFDASYRFSRPVAILTGRTADVVISREFRTARVIDNSTDYRTARLLFEIGNPSGLHDLVFTGTLKPGGEIDNIDIRVTDAPVP